MCPHTVGGVSKRHPLSFLRTPFLFTRTTFQLLHQPLKVLSLSDAVFSKRFQHRDLREINAEHVRGPLGSVSVLDVKAYAKEYTSLDPGMVA